MSVPNLGALVRQVYQDGHYDLTTKSGCGTFTEECARILHRTDPRFGHLLKINRPGGNQWNQHAVDAVLHLSDQAGQSVAVDIVSAGESPEAEPGWGLDQPRYSAGDWADPVNYPAWSAAGHKTRLGCSLFWAPAGYVKYRDQLNSNLQWIAQYLKADYVRIIALTRGDKFKSNIDGQYYDPWDDVGGDLSWLNQDVIRKTTEHIASFGLKTEWSLLGGRAQAPTLDRMLGVVDLFADALTPLLDHVEFVEMWNELRVNRGTEEECRAMAKRMRSKLPAGFPIALSSLTTIHGAPVGGEAGYDAFLEEVKHEWNALYGGDSGANIVTAHWSRVGGPGPGFLRQFTSMPVYNNEPRGLNSSVRTADALTIANLYRDAINMDEAGFVFHSQVGVFGGHLAGNFGEEQFLLFTDYPEAAQVASSLSTLRAGGSPVTPQPTPTGEHMAKHPYPDENSYWKDFERRLADVYARAGITVPAEALQSGRFFARTAWDLADSLTPEQSAEKHLKEVAELLGV